MKMLLTLILAVAAFSQSHAAASDVAYFTGRMEQTTTITGTIGWNCEYDFRGQKFWLFFTNLCPNMVVSQD